MAYGEARKADFTRDEVDAGLQKAKRAIGKISKFLRDPSTSAAEKVSILSIKKISPLLMPENHWINNINKFYTNRSATCLKLPVFSILSHQPSPIS